MSESPLIRHLIDITRHVFEGDTRAANELIGFIRDEQNIDSDIAELAETLSLLIVQRDVYAFRLEGMIEDLLAAQRDAEDAQHDALTGLPGRSLFHNQLQIGCENINKGRSLALLYIDLDKFKGVNDTHGHDAGDQVLRMASERMQACLQPGDILARLGGDEFACILPQVDGVQHAVAVAANMVEQLCRPMDFEGLSIGIGASIGVSLYPDDADAPIALLKNADIAMYTAKADGRNGYAVYRKGSAPKSY